MNTEKLVKIFRQHYEDETGEKLDFRSKVYAFNSFGCYPQGNIGDKEVDILYKWMNDYCENNSETTLGGFVYNRQISLNDLAHTKYKDFVYSAIDQIVIHSREKVRIVWDGCDSYITVEEARENPDKDYKNGILWAHNESFLANDVFIIDESEIPLEDGEQDFSGIYSFIHNNKTVFAID